jgi:hypothetical protein
VKVQKACFVYQFFVDSGNIVSLLFFSRLIVPEYFKPEKTAVDFTFCVKAPSQQSTDIQTFA